MIVIYLAIKAVINLLYDDYGILSSILLDFFTFMAC